MATQTIPYTTITTRQHHPYYHAASSQPLCRYRSKVCNNPRAHKRDDPLHRYCEEHRQRANMNQKKWAKRRMEEVDMRHLQLTYQQLLNTELATLDVSAVATDTDSHTLPTQIAPVRFEETTRQWVPMDVEEAPRMTKNTGLSWESLGLDGFEEDKNKSRL